MPSTDDEVEGVDPFDPEYVARFNLVVNMRIYDVLMALLNEENSELCDRLNEVHQAGGIVADLPWLGQ